MIQFIQWQDGQLDSFVIDRKNNSGTSDYRIVDEHSWFKRWVWNNTSKDQLYTLIQTRISQAAQDVLKVHWTHKENRYTWVINQFHKSLSDQFWKDYFGYHMINMWHMLDQEAHFPYVHILRGKPDEEIEKFAKQHGVTYPFCKTDPITLKTIIRANPGLMVIENGTIKEKRNWRDF